MRNRIHYLVVMAAIILALVSLGAKPAPVAAQGKWYAEYFPNRDLAGGPSITRYEDELHFEWGKGSPGGKVPSDGFSARWTRDEWFENGTYRFTYRSDDGIRIWVGDTLVVDDWHERSAIWSSMDYVIPRGTHRVRVEYFEHVGAAVVQAGWERIAGGAGWRAEYFDNRKPTGAPVLVRFDPAIDFDWKQGSPDPAVPADEFSARWTRSLGFTGGTYRFHASCDDGARVFVDGNLVLDAWRDQSTSQTHSGDIALTSGQHAVVVEYYEHGGQASAHVWWNLLASFGGWEGRYYDNAELRGGPALIRDDAAIDFDWGEGAPADWMPADNFSAAWTRQVNFAPGFYRFNVRSDDGVRVWLDGGLLMDYWQPQEYAWHYVDGTYLTGVHTLKVEYYERAGGARIRFWWESSGPASSSAGLPGGPGGPAPTPPLAMPGPWQGEYFGDRDLTGAPVLRRNDATLDFDWGWAAPAATMSGDDFSARWSGSFFFRNGRYTFTTYSDDGVRVYVDDRLLIDSWKPMRGYRSATLALGEGSHAIRVEYFERTGVALIRFWWKESGEAGTTAAAPQQVTIPLSSPVQPCEGGPLRLDAWPVGATCTKGGGGWVATIFVEGHGGNCQYTYGWERQVQGGPMPGSMTFEVKSATRGIAIVGEVSVTSGEETVKFGLHVRSPQCGR